MFAEEIAEQEELKQAAGDEEDEMSNFIEHEFKMDEAEAERERKEQFEQKMKI